MAGKIAVLIDARLHNELVLRTRSTSDVTSYIEHALEGFLDRTATDGGLWNHQYIEELASLEENQQLRKYGDPNKGYQWQMVFLPNSTKLMMTYMGIDHYAEVMHEKIVYEGNAYSPSELASRIANNTRRNAWRDLWIQLPDSSQWKLANEIRWEEKKRRGG